MASDLSTSSNPAGKYIPSPGSLSDILLGIEAPVNESPMNQGRHDVFAGVAGMKWSQAPSRDLAPWMLWSYSTVRW